MDSGLILFILGLTVITITVYYSWLLGISPTPSSPAAKKALLELLPSSIEGKVYELGAGWGGLLKELRDRYPNVVGFELSPLPWLVCKLRGLPCVRKDFFQQDLKEAKLIICYLYPGAMKRLQHKFETELQPGTIIISNTFQIPGWQPQEVRELNDLYKSKIYLYRKS